MHEKKCKWNGIVTNKMKLNGKKLYEHKRRKHKRRKLLHTKPLILWYTKTLISWWIEFYINAEEEIFYIDFNTIFRMVMQPPYPWRKKKLKQMKKNYHFSKKV